MARKVDVKTTIRWSDSDTLLLRAAGLLDGNNRTTKIVISDFIKKLVRKSIMDNIAQETILKEELKEEYKILDKHKENIVKIQEKLIEVKNER